jgi:UDP-glucose 4-epimerase
MNWPTPASALSLTICTGFDWAVAKGVPLIVGDTGDQNLLAQIIREHNVDSIIHFAASLVVPTRLKTRSAITILSTHGR